MALSYLYLDYETFLFQPGCLAPPPVVLSYARDDDPVRLLHANFDRWELEKLLWGALRDKNTVFVAYQCAMEVITTLAWRTHWVPLIFQSLRDGRWHDPFLDEKLIRIGKGDRREVLNLAATLDAYMIPHSVDKSSHWRTRYGELWDVPCDRWDVEAPGAREYSEGDIAVRPLHREQRARNKPEYFADSANRVRTSVALGLTSAWGFPVDLVQAETLYVETQARIAKHKESLIAAQLLQAKFEKGVMKWSRKKEPAEKLITDAYAAMGREPPRGDLTAKMLNDAYEAAGMPLQTPYTKRDKIKDKDIDEAIQCGVPEELLIGNISLDAEACETSGNLLLEAYSEYGQANTILGKAQRLIDAAKAGKPIQAYYNPCVNTGRTSCSQGEGPAPGEAYSSYGTQIQNLMRAGEEYVDEKGRKQQKWGQRECFVAPGFESFLLANPQWRKLKLLCAKDLTLLPEEVIVSVDFDAFEMRTWAQCCLWILGYSDLAAILNDTRRCPHIEMGCRLHDAGEHFNADGATWQDQYAWAYGLKKGDADAKKLLKNVRGLAKGPNFGLPGGMGWQRLMDYCRLNYGAVLTEQQARFACAVWREVYREAQPYLDHITNDVLGGKYGKKGSIVQFISMRIRGDVGFCDASNGYFQGLAADAATAAGWALMEEAYERTDSPFYGARPLAFVHDEWLFAVRRDRLHEAAHRMRDVQLAAAQRFCPDVVLTASPAAMYRWSKVAGDPFYIKDGRASSLEAGGELIPYEESLAWAA